MSEENPAPESSISTQIQDILEVLGLKDQNIEANVQNPQLFENILFRAKMLLTANRELKSQNQQIKQEVEEISAAKMDETEKDRLIGDLLQKLNAQRSGILKLATVFQNQLRSTNPDAELLEKIDVFKAAQEKIMDLEEKLTSQRTANIKTRTELEERTQSLEIQLTQTKDRCDQIQKDYQEYQRKTTEEKATQSGGTVDVKELEQLQAKFNEIQPKLNELELQNQELRATNQQHSEKLSKLEDVDAKLQTKDQQLEELEAEIQQKIRQIENTKNELTHLQEIQQQNKELFEKLDEKDKSLQELGKAKAEIETRAKALENSGVSIAAELNQLRQAVVEKDAEIDNLKQTVQTFGNLQGEIERLKQQEITLNQKILDQTSWIAELEKTMNHEKSENGSLLARLEESQNAQKLKEERLVNIEADLSKLQEENQKVRTDLSVAADGSNQVATELNNQLLAKEQQIGELKSKIKSLEDILPQMVKREDLENVRKELEELEQELTTKDANLLARSKELQDIKQNFEIERKQLQEKINAHQNEGQKAIDLQKSLQEKSDHIRRLEQSFEELQAKSQEFDQLKQNHIEATTQLQETIQQKEYIFDMMKKLKADNAGDKAVIERLEARIKDMQGKGIRENVEADLLRRKVGDLETEMRQQIMKATEAQVRWETMKDQYDRFKTDIDRTTEEKRQLQDDKKHLQNELDSNKKEMEIKIKEAQEGGHLKEELLRLNKTLEETSQMNDSLVEDVAKLKTENMVLQKDKQTIEEETINLKRKIKLLRRNVGGPATPPPK